MKPTLVIGIILFLTTSCSIQKEPNQVAERKNNYPAICQYEYLGFEYPDSSDDTPGPMGKLLNSLPKDAPLYYVIGDQNIALVRYNKDGTLSERKVYSTSSDRVILFTYDDDGQYFRNLSDVKNSSIERMEKGLPSEAKYYNGIKCEKYTMIKEGGSSGNTVYVNEAIPIDYYKGIENAPKGVPFYKTYDFMMGIYVNYGVIDSIPDIKDPNSLLSITTENYIDLDALNNNLINASGLNQDIENFGNKQTTYLSNRNDTVVAITPLCTTIRKFELDIDVDKLRLYYITAERKDTTATASKGPIYDIELINDSLYTAKYKDVYSDEYSIYFDSKDRAKSFSQTWKTRRKSSYLWESFSNTCLSDQDVTQILQDVSSAILNIESPKIFITSREDFDNTSWMVDISEYAFSKSY